MEKEEELAELLKDKARLDWLADVNNTVGNVLLPRDIVERALNMRDAIDEAMALEERYSKPQISENKS